MLLLLFFFSGFCALAYQVLWVRELQLVIGNTVQASAIVVAATMAGLGLGAHVSGQIGWRNRIRAYAMLELALASWASLLPFAMRLARWICSVAPESWNESPTLALT